MLYGNQMQKELVRAGLVDKVQEKKQKKGKKFFCHKCGEEMYKPDWGNFLVCRKCANNYFLFTK